MQRNRKPARRRPKRRQAALVKAATKPAKIRKPKVPSGSKAIVVGSHQPTGQQSPALVYLARLGSDKSRRSMLDAMKRIIRVLEVVDGDGDPIDPIAFPWHLLSYEQIELVRNKLSEYCSPSTANHALCAVRGVLKVAWKQRLIDTDTYHRCASVEGIRGSRIPAGRHVSYGEIQSMFEVCEDGTASGARNAVVVGMLYGCGLRRSELAEARLENLDLESRSLRVIGKGNKERVVFFPVGTYRAIRHWVKQYRGELPGPLVVRMGQKDQITDHPLSDESIRYIVLEVIKKAELKPMSPHDLRRSWIGELLDRGADISTVQQLAGHASPVTTARYDRRGEKTKRAAVLLLDVPFSKPKKDDE